MLLHRFVDRSHVSRLLNGRTVAIVGSGPGVLENADGFVDGHEVVVRVNNYKIRGASTGRRTDVFYSFFGNSIKKTRIELKRDGVQLCMGKCPDAAAIESEWHKARGSSFGVDFRWIYRKRAGWWFCPTYVPPLEDFLATFNLLGRHVPTTGFAAIVDVLQFAPRSVYLTGFDFFRSGIHNVDERWVEKNKDDPIRHEPERELVWLRERMKSYPITCDATLSRMLGL